MDQEIINEINKSMSNLDISKGLLAWQLVNVEVFMKDYIEKEKVRDLDERIDVLIYDTTKLIQSRVYEKHYENYKSDFHCNLSGILMKVIVCSIVSGVSLGKILELGLQRYHDRVWEIKYDNGVSNSIIDKGLLVWRYIDLQKFMEICIKKDKLKELDDRVDILVYNTTKLLQSREHMKKHGSYEADFPTKLSDILMITLACSIIAGISLTKLLELGLQRYNDKVWEMKHE